MKNIYKENYDIYLDLDCTSPIRDIEDIYKAIELFQKSNVDAIFSICESRKNPYFNMVEYNEEKKLKIVKSLGESIVRRQDAPKVYDHVASMYVLNPNYLRKGKNLLSGKVEGYDIGIDKSLDLDSEFDFELIEYLMKKKFKKN